MVRSLQRLAAVNEASVTFRLATTYIAELVYKHVTIVPTSAPHKEITAALQCGPHLLNSAGHFHNASLRHPVITGRSRKLVINAHTCLSISAIKPIIYIILRNTVISVCVIEES